MRWINKITGCFLLVILFGSIPRWAVDAAPDPMTRDEIMHYARSGVGYSYWWGGECWREDGTCPGSCSGSCPGCTHSACCSAGCGEYGADCSGFATKVWQVPSPIALDACDVFRYTTYQFRYRTDLEWDRIPREELLRGDCAVYNSGSGGHIVVFERGDPWGSLWTYEARGCSYGIVHNSRTLSSSYIAIRRHNIIEGECNPGQTESEDCGDCGTRQRVCGDDYNWGDWSQCEGVDPDGGNQVCDTHQQGICGEGRVRCVEGWLRCVGINSPSDELCDGLDNNCDGQVDEGSPTTVGEPAPAYAAEVISIEAPDFLIAGRQMQIGLTVRNVGTEGWTMGQISISCPYRDGSNPCQLYDPSSWIDSRIVARIDSEVSSGQEEVVWFHVLAPVDADNVEERFVLLDPDENEIKCPKADFYVRGQIVPPSEDEDYVDLVSQEELNVEITVESSVEGVDATSMYKIDGLEGGCSCSFVTG